MPPETEWERYRVHILAELQRFNDTAKSIDGKVEDLHRTIVPGINTRIALLELKAGLWGAGASIAMTTILGILARFVQ